MSPTDFTDSHRLFVRVCLNLPQISQILYSLVEFPYLCKSVQSVGVFLSYAICGNFLSCVISGRIPQEYLPQISQILTDCWCAFVLIFYDFTDSVFLGGFPYLCKSVQSVGAFCRMQSVGVFFCRVQSVEPFCRVQSVGETLYLEYPFILRCISLFILSVLKLTSIPKCKLHKRR